MSIGTRPAKVLLIEDNLGDARLLQEALRESDSEHLELSHVDHLQDGLKRIEGDSVDLVLLDLSLPDASGLETVARTRAAAPNVAIVVLTGLDDEVVAIEAVRKGAQDYLVKGQMDGNLLLRAMRYAMERQQLASELEETRRQQLEMKEQFLSHVSHELRSPLTAVYGFVTIVLDGLAGGLTPEQREYLEIGLKNIRQLQRMVDDLLDAARAEGGTLLVELEPTDLRPLIEETIASFGKTADDKDLRLISELPAALPEVYADPARVREVLINLIDNAIKFTPSGGRITVAAESSEEEPGFVQVCVADTGSGISPEGIEKIFERFHQESDGHKARRSLGLGLYICKQLIASQGGRVWVQSETGRGSTFFFTLPLLA